MTLADEARRWMADDPDPETVEETEAHLHDPAWLEARFGGRLDFGTAGLRGPLGAGPNAMNRAMVQRVGAAFARVLLEDSPGGLIVVGYDGRRNSRVFAEDTARVLGGAGFDVALFDDVCPTPRLAHAVTHLGARGGVMVTASHNPPGDNGYKVYAADGAQIVPPLDERISLAVDDVLADLRGLEAIPLPPLDELVAAGRVRPVPASAWDDYLARVLALRVHADDARRARLKIVYSAMHGVGSAAVRAVMEAAGHTIVEVPEQAEPDGAFPTVAFPNPEEKGAMDLAIALAKRVRADLVLANDPDADRLAVVIPVAGGWRPLTGNEVGCLLADDLLTHGPQDPERLVATTLVSSSLLSRIARQHGADYAETLTGFKWIAHAAMPYDRAGGRFVIGYEEALGYSAGDVVRDKDGVSAVLLFADLAASWKVRGHDVLTALEEMGRAYGVYVSRQLSVTRPGAEGAEQIRRTMQGLRLDRIERIGGVAVARVTDVLAGTTVDLADGTRASVDLPKSDVLAWVLHDGSRILARPSGTEPKIKFYFEVVEPLASGERLRHAEERAASRIESLMQAFRGVAQI